MADIIYKINNNKSDYNLAPSTYYTCITQAGTTAKVAYLHGGSSNTFCNGTIPTGVTIYVKFTYSNTASNPTLNVNGSGAKSIKRYGTTAVGTSSSTSGRAGAVVAFTYDGTYWVMNTGIDDDTTTDTKNTAGATQQNGTLYIIGAPTQTTSSQTYSSSGVSLYNGCLRTEGMNIRDSLGFSGGGHISVDQEDLEISSQMDNTEINSDLYVNAQININEGKVATKEGVMNYLGTANNELTIGFKHDTPSEGTEVWYYNAAEAGPSTITSSLTRTYRITPYTGDSISRKYYLYIEGSTLPEITGNGDVSVTRDGNTNLYRIRFYCENGNLADESCSIFVKCGSIYFTLVILFDRNYYVN